MRIWASLVAQTVKNASAIQETWVQSLGQEDPLEKGMAIHSSILAGRIPRTEEPGELQSMRLQTVRHDLATNTHENIPGLDSGHENMTVLEAWGRQSSCSRRRFTRATISLLIAGT